MTKKKSEFRLAVERRNHEIEVLKRLRKQMKLRIFSSVYWKIKKDVKYYDTFLLDLVEVSKRVKTVTDLELLVNKYVEMDYKTYMIVDEEPMKYRIGVAKQVFAKLHYDSKNNREGEALFVGS
jgi:hypothetical protein